MGFGGDIYQTPADASNKPATDSLGLHSQSTSSDESDAHLVLTPTLTFSNHNDVRVMLQKSSISGQLVVTRDLLPNASDRARELWKEEQSIHARLSHPNIVRVISTSAERIVLEHANACDLRAFSKRKLPLGIPTGLKEVALRPILQALQYLHEQDIVHRDIKPENVFMTMENGRLVAKLGDFGFACMAGTDHRSCGTDGFMAPEVKWLTSQGCTYDCKADVFSFGAMVLDCLVKCTLGPLDLEDALLPGCDGLDHLMQVYLPGNDVLQDFLLRACCYDRHKRASAKELLAHPWMA